MIHGLLGVDLANVNMPNIGERTIAGAVHPRRGNESRQARLYGLRGCRAVGAASVVAVGKR